MHTDGRVCWPDVLLYHYLGDPENTFHVVPPLEKEKSYRLLVIDWKRYDELFSSGDLFNANHTGWNYRITDNRRGGRG